MPSFFKQIVELEQGGGDVDSKRLSDVVQALIGKSSPRKNRVICRDCCTEQSRECCATGFGEVMELGCLDSRSC